MINIAEVDPISGAIGAAILSVAAGLAYMLGNKRAQDDGPREPRHVSADPETAAKIGEMTADMREIKRRQDKIEQYQEMASRELVIVANEQRELASQQRELTRDMRDLTKMHQALLGEREKADVERRRLQEETDRQFREMGQILSSLR